MTLLPVEMVKRSSAVRLGGCCERQEPPVVAGNGLDAEFRAAWVRGCQCPRDAGEREGLPVVTGDGPGEAFRVGEEPGAAGVGGCQYPRDGGEREGQSASRW